MFFEEGLPVDTIWIALQGERAIRYVRQHHFGNLGVVVENLTLGETGLGVKDLFQVGQCEPAPVDLRLYSLRTHGSLHRRLCPDEGLAMTGDEGDRDWSWLKVAR